MRFVTYLFLTLFGVSVAVGQSAEQQKLLAKRAAEADAYRKLAETVYGIQLNSRTHVRDFVTESDEIRGALDEFVKGVRLGEPRWYSDHSCEVPAEVTVKKVVQTLREAHERHYDGDRVTQRDFEKLTERIDRNVIKVVGMGAPREDLPLALPDGVREQLEIDGEAPGDRSIPAIWRQIGPQARLMAIRAARLDALRRLAERVKGLRLTSRTTVADFMAESDVIDTELNAALVGAEEVDTYLHHDELIAEVKLRLPVKQTISTISRLVNKRYRGDDVEGFDIERVKQQVKRDHFEATGMGVPNPRFIKRYRAEHAPEMPEWSTIALEAEASVRIDDPAAANDAQMRLRAARAAEVAARETLAELIEQLRLNADMTVSDFLDRAGYLEPQLSAVAVDAAVIDTRLSEESVTVRVSIPGVRVWEVIHQEIRRERRAE